MIINDVSWRTCCMHLRAILWHGCVCGIGGGELMIYCEHTFGKYKANPKKELVFFIEEEVEGTSYKTNILKKVMG